MLFYAFRNLSSSLYFSVIKNEKAKYLQFQIYFQSHFVAKSVMKNGKAACREYTSFSTSRKPFDAPVLGLRSMQPCQQACYMQSVLHGGLCQRRMAQGVQNNSYNPQQRIAIAVSVTFLQGYTASGCTYTKYCPNCEITLEHLILLLRAEKFAQSHKTFQA